MVIFITWSPLAAGLFEVAGAGVRVDVVVGMIFLVPRAGTEPVSNSAVEATHLYIGLPLGSVGGNLPPRRVAQVSVSGSVVLLALDRDVLATANRVANLLQLGMVLHPDHTRVRVGFRNHVSNGL